MFLNPRLLLLGQRIAVRAEVCGGGRLGGDLSTGPAAGPRRRRHGLLVSIHSGGLCRLSHVTGPCPLHQAAFASAIALAFARTDWR